MAFTRRQFIKRTGIAAAGSVFAPSFFRSPLLTRALAAPTVGDRYLIVLFLDGGNDGQNTIIPYDDGGGSLRTDYNAARNAGGGGIQISPGDLLVPTSVPFIDPTGAQLGFHPGLNGIYQMYENGQVAVVQGAGYPDYSLSHEVSRSIWQTGSPFTTAGTGWMGRYLQASMYGGGDIPAVTIGGSVANEFIQNATSVLAFSRLSNFGFPFDEDYPNYDDDMVRLIEETAKRDAFDALYGGANANPNTVMKYIGNSGAATLLATDSYPALHDNYQTDRLPWSKLYQYDQTPKGLNTSTARDLREIAKVIYGVASGVPNVNARFFELHNGGYDTHSDQGGAEVDGQHYRLHKEIGDAIKLFFDDLANMSSGAAPGTGLENLADKVCVLVWSEFSRRIPQNDNGTDHGSQGPMFLIGGVNGGVYGNHANISEAALNDDGNTKYTQAAGAFRSTDIRDVYGTVMQHWLGMPDAAPLFPIDTVPVGEDPDDYWTVRNFNLPIF